MQTEIGPYRIEGELGRGGMGAVYRARGQDGRAVAVKVMLGARSGSTERFAREARLLTSLGERDGFVPILESGVGPGGPWFAMPLLEGGTLRERLRGGALEVPEAVQLVIRLARAVGVAHARGIVHRDLKPENVIFTGPGRPLVSDLGLAKHFDPAAPGASQSVALTRTGELKGTLGYMAPEQINDAKSVGPQADVFALGAILHELLSGRCPFDGDTPHEIIARIVQGEPSRLRDSRPDAPRWVQAVLSRALAREPAARYPDGEALARALEAGEENLPRTPRGLVALGVAVGVLLGVVAVGVVVVANRPAPVEAQVADPAPAPLAPAAPVAPPAAAEPAVVSLPASVAALGPAGALRLSGAWGASAGFSLGVPIVLRCTTDGASVVLADDVGGVRVWSRRSGTFVRLAGRLTAPAVAMTLSRDAGLVLASARDGTVTLFEVGGSTRWTTPARGEGAVGGVAISPDDRTAAWITRSADGLGVCVADVRTGEVRVLSLAPPEGAVAAFRPDDPTRLLVAGGGPGVLGEIDVQWGSAVRVLMPIGQGSAGGPQAIHTLSVSGDGRLALSADGRGGLMLWDLKTGRDTRRLGDPARLVRACAIDASGARAAAAIDDRVLVWELDRPDEPAVELMHGGRVTCVDFAPDGRQVITGCEDRRVRAWDLAVAHGQLQATPSWDPVGLVWISSVSRLPSGDLLVSGSQGTERWDAASGRATAAFRGHPGNTNGLALHPDGVRVLSVGHDRSARVWSLTDGEELYGQLVGGNNIICCALSPDGRRGLIGTDDPSVLVLDLEQTAVVAALQAPSHWVNDVAFSGDGAVSLCATHAGSLHAWDRTNRPLHTVQAHAGPLRMDVRGDLDRVVTTGAGEVAVWDLTGPAPRERARHRVPGADRVRLLPDRERALVANAEGVILLIDLQTGAELGRVDLAPIDDTVRSLGVDAQGGLLVGTTRGIVLRLEAADR